MSPAERADVIVDFTNIPVGTEILLLNLAPDEPFGGGEVGEDFPPANEQTTGQIMQFRVVAAKTADVSSRADRLILPPVPDLGEPVEVRRLSLNEAESDTVFVPSDSDGNYKLDSGGNLVFDPPQRRSGPPRRCWVRWFSKATTERKSWSRDPCTFRIR